MGLFLTQQQMWDRPLGGTQKKGQIPHWAGLILFGVLAFLCKVLFRYRVDNLESLRGFKGKSGVVVVGNHTSYLDVVFMFIAAMPGQWTRFMGRDTLFEKGARASWLDNIARGGLPGQAGQRRPQRRQTRCPHAQGRRGRGHHARGDAPRQGQQDPRESTPGPLWWPRWAQLRFCP